MGPEGTAADRKGGAGARTGNYASFSSVYYQHVSRQLFNSVTVEKPEKFHSCLR